MIDVVTERDLDWVDKRVVAPIVSSVFTSEERRDLRVSLSLGPDVRHPDPGGLAWWIRPSEDGRQWVWVRFVLRSSMESAQMRLFPVEALDYLEAMHQAAVDLGELVEDWFCETKVGWGQQRHAQVPPLDQM